MVPAGARCKGRPDVVSSLVKYSTESHRPSLKAMAVSQMWFYISIYVSIKIRPWWLKNRGPTTPPSPTSKPPPSTSPNLLLLPHTPSTHQQYPPPLNADTARLLRTSDSDSGLPVETPLSDAPPLENPQFRFLKTAKGEPPPPQSKRPTSRLTVRDL